MGALVSLKYYLVLLTTLFVAASACKKKADDSASGVFESGDIVISNNLTKSVLLFNSSGVFKKTLYAPGATSGETPFGIHYNSHMETLMILLDGTADKVVSVAKSDGAVNEVFIVDTNLNSATANSVRAITQLTTGDLLIGETSAIERFSYNGFRVTSDSDSGVWPKTGAPILTTVMTQLSPLPDGGAIACSTGSDVIRTYDNTMTQVGSVASGIAATTDVFGCIADNAGGVYAAFNGTTDTIRKYSDDTLGTVDWSYSNTSLLGNPVALAVLSNGNIAALDATFNWVIEISPAGAFVNKLGGATSDINNMLSTPNFIYVIP